jgi:hypothetical protein
MVEALRDDLRLQPPQHRTNGWACAEDAPWYYRDEKMSRSGAERAYMRDILAAFVREVENVDGDWPGVSAGCLECTSGVTPDRYNTGPCAYHAAKALLDVRA